MQRSLPTLFLVVSAFAAMTRSAAASEAQRLQISVLCDDTVSSDKFVTEHGVSLLVELRNGHRWLVDTGTTDVFLENAKRMGVSLDNLDGVAISHGHDDHTGGLQFYPRLKGAPPIYGHPYIWHKTFQVKTGEPVRVCGMPYLARKYAHPNFHPIGNVTKLDEDFFAFTDVPRPPGSFAPVQGNFFNEDGTGPCPLLDDTTFVVKTARGLVVMLGCGHAGYTNILKAIRKEFPNDKLLSVMGGLHLLNASDKVIEEAVSTTDSFKAEGFSFYGGHCTGDKAVKQFRAKFGDAAVRPMGSGRTMDY